MLIRLPRLSSMNVKAVVGKLRTTSARSRIGTDLYEILAAMTRYGHSDQHDPFRLERHYSSLIRATQRVASGYASHSHTLRSMPLYVLPPDQETLGQVLLPDQGGI